MSDVKTTCEKLLEGVPDDTMILVHKVDVIRLTTSPVSEANGFDIRRAAMARMRLDLAASTQDAPTPSSRRTGMLRSSGPISRRGEGTW